MSKTKLFSVTIKDFEVQNFRVGGAGGQRRDKVSTGVRVIHRPSGARGESREERSQNQNKKIAWKRCIETPEFKRWLDIEIRKRNGQAALDEQRIEEAVRKAVRPKNLLVEVRVDDEWKEENQVGHSS